MISDYFEAPWRLEQMRSSCIGPHLDGFASALANAGYTLHTIRGYIRTAAHAGRWADRRGIDLASWDEGTLRCFRRHLSQCRCTKRNKGVFRDAFVEWSNCSLTCARIRSSRE